VKKNGSVVGEGGWKAKLKKGRKKTSNARRRGRPSRRGGVHKRGAWLARRPGNAQRGKKTNACVLPWGKKGRRPGSRTARARRWKTRAERKRKTREGKEGVAKLQEVLIRRKKAKRRPLKEKKRNGRGARRWKESLLLRREGPYCGSLMGESVPGVAKRTEKDSSRGEGEQMSSSPLKTNGGFS